MKKIFIVTGHSESGDDYGPKRFNKKPTNPQLRQFIKDTGEELDCNGPGDFGSYVYLDIKEV